MRKKKKLGALLLSGVLATSMLLGGLGNTNANTTDYDNPPIDVPSCTDSSCPTPYAYHYNSSDPLYAATHFHFFGKDYVRIGAHCHGNVATTKLSAGHNSGSNKLGDQVSSELFYFREADASQGFIADFAGATIILGAKIDTKLINNTELNFSLNDGSYKKIEPNSTVYTESDESKPFIDLEAEFKKLNALSTHLVSQYNGSANTVSDSGIDVTNDGVNYTIDLKGQTETTAYLNIDGANLGGGGDFTDRKSVV